jgi:hypothetical protein
VRLGAGIHDRDIHVVVNDVEDLCDQESGAADNGLSWLQIHLYLKTSGEVGQRLSEAVEWIAILGKGDASAEADPPDVMQERIEPDGNRFQNRLEPVEVVVLAVDVEHCPVEEVPDAVDRVGIGGPEPGALSRRIGQVEGGMTDTRVDAQADRTTADLRRQPLQLRHRIENHLGRERPHRLDVIVRERDVVGVDLFAELFVTEPRLEW